jgi:hypothetical protein
MSDCDRSYIVKHSNGKVITAGNFNDTFIKRATKAFKWNFIPCSIEVMKKYLYNINHPSHFDPLHKEFYTMPTGMHSKYDLIPVRSYGGFNENK